MLQLQLDIVSHDRPDMARHIMRLLSQQRIDIDAFGADTMSGPFCGGQLFKMRARLCAPPGLDIDMLRETIEGLANELMVDIRCIDTTAGGSGTHTVLQSQRGD